MSSSDRKNNFKDKLKYKLKATLVHLLLSLMIFVVILYFILYKWYPEPFFTAQGGWKGIQLMIFVDLVLGPSLTFIVFNHLKKRKEIIFDLTVIAMIQISALLVGGHAVYSQRPIALVFWTNAFYTVTEEDYTIQGIKSPDFSQYSDNIPPLIYSRPIATQGELDLSIELTDKRIPAYAHVSQYEDIKDNLPAIYTSEVNLSDLMLYNDEMYTLLDESVQGDIKDYRYIALKAKYQNMVLIFTPDGELVGEVKVPYFNQI